MPNRRNTAFEQLVLREVWCSVPTLNYTSTRSRGSTNRQRSRFDGTTLYITTGGERFSTVTCPRPELKKASQ